MDSTATNIQMTAEEVPTARPGPRISVLSTLNPDGSRRWLKPRPSPGKLLTARRVVAWILILVFTAAPYIRFGGKPLILLDLATRRFTFFGYTFLPTDTILLALFMMSVFVLVFLLTALLGRVWCGWACPQTVYMEFLYRPVERFFEGTPGRAKKWSWQGSGAAKAAKYLVFVVASCYLAHTFLAYFVGVDTLRTWITGSPFRHPAGFMVMAVVTGLMLFDFGFFREQVCLVACPYGRFQSVMLDRRSLIVSYDTMRGEPRGRKRSDLGLKVLNGATRAAPMGDCVDCGLCVTTCPTGIDIRNGLQMECVSCAQCIDACNAVMSKLGRQPGLIRYSSQASLAGEPPRVFRTRVAIYCTILAVLVTGLVTLLVTKPAADLVVLRSRGAPFVERDDGMIGNNVRVKVTNRTEKPVTYTLATEGISGAKITSEQNRFEVSGGEVLTVPAMIDVPRGSLTNGSVTVTVVLIGNEQTRREAVFRVVGPAVQVQGGGR